MITADEREALILQYLPLAKKVGALYLSCYEEREEREAMAMEFLIHAVDSFKKGRGMTLKSWIATSIKFQFGRYNLYQWRGKRKVQFMIMLCDHHDDDSDQDRRGELIDTTSDLDEEVLCKERVTFLQKIFTEFMTPWERERYHRDSRPPYRRSARQLKHLLLRRVGRRLTTLGYRYEDFF